MLIYIIFEVLCVHFVDEVKCSVLAIVGEIPRNGCYHYYYYSAIVIETVFHRNDHYHCCFIIQPLSVKQHSIEMTTVIVVLLFNHCR